MDSSSSRLREVSLNRYLFLESGPWLSQSGVLAAEDPQCVGAFGAALLAAEIQ